MTNFNLAWPQPLIDDSLVEALFLFLFVPHTIVMLTRFEDHKDPATTPLAQDVRYTTLCPLVNFYDGAGLVLVSVLYYPWNRFTAEQLVARDCVHGYISWGYFFDTTSNDLRSGFDWTVRDRLDTRLLQQTICSVCWDVSVPDDV